MTAPAFALRPVEAADLPFLWELRRSTLREYMEQMWGWEDGEQRRRFFAGLTPERLARTPALSWWSGGRTRCTWPISRCCPSSRAGASVRR